jgi:hypothetical protein
MPLLPSELVEAEIVTNKDFSEKVKKPLDGYSNRK